MFLARSRPVACLVAWGSPVGLAETRRMWDRMTRSGRNGLYQAPDADQGSMRLIL